MIKSKTWFSLRKKAIFFIVLMAIALSCVALIVASGTVISGVNSIYRKEATQLAQTISRVVNAEDVAALQRDVDLIYDSIDDKVSSEKMGTEAYDAYINKFSGIKDTESYKNLYTVLRGIQESNDVESVYILFVDVPMETTVYLVDASDKPCSPGNFDPLYEMNYAVLNDPTVGFPAYITNTKEYGWLVSAGVPIYAEDGSVPAYAFTDISMNAIHRSQHAFEIRLSLILLVMTGIICAFYIYLVNRLLVKPVNMLSNAAIGYYDAEVQNKRSFEALDIQSRDEIGNLSQAMKQMERDMNAYIHDLTAVTAEKERIGAELNIAAQIQADMLPGIFPPFPNRHEFDIYAIMDPAKEVGGDFYDFFLIDDDHLCLVMADVSGKGVPAALFMVIAKTLIKNRAQMGESPAEILNNVNNQLCEGNEADLFVTVWLGILEISTGKGVAANAGHEHPAVCRKGGNYELVVYRHSPAVATLKGLRFREHEFELHPGDRLFVYTDGVPEATNMCEELFGTERMLVTLNLDTNASPETQLRNMRQRIDTFVGKAPQFDDITMLALYYKGPEKEAN